MYSVALPSGATAGVSMEASAGELFIVVGLAAVGLVLFFSLLRDVAWLNSKR
jgi:hypothetical protein